MYLFHNDYNKMCHPRVLEKMQAMADEPMTSYGIDECCQRGADLIRKACNNEAVAVHFLVGGTQTNLTVIAASLRAHQAVVAAHSGHISEHETGAIEATGHKIIMLPTDDGKITAEQVREVADAHVSGDGPGREHMAQPKLVYISQPTEFGTLYNLAELEALSSVCRDRNMYLYVDGARLGYGITAGSNDVTLPDLARLCDAFYIGGTKVGAMFGEAVVIANPDIAEDFRYYIKQRGGMLAKGWLLGLQFEALFEDGLYFKIGKNANHMADKIRRTLAMLKYPMPVDSDTNQVFATMPDGILKELGRNFTFTDWCRVDENHRTVRFCTSWATTQESTDALCAELIKLSE